MTFKTDPGKTYQFQRSFDGTDWEAIGDPFPGDGSTVTLEDEGVAGANDRAATDTGNADSN